MSQLTLRGLDKNLEQHVQQVAMNEHTSLNKAALQLLRRGAGLERNTAVPNVIGNQLDDFIGTWSAADEAALEKSAAAFETIDPEQWQ